MIPEANYLWYAFILLIVLGYCLRERVVSQRGVDQGYCPLEFIPSTLVQLEPEGEVAEFRGCPKGTPCQFLVSGQDRAQEFGLDLTDLAVYGSVSLDLDKDGYSDLILTTDQGVILMKNNLQSWELRGKGLKFTPRLMLGDRQDGLRAYSVIVYDLDQDGNPDLILRYFSLDQPWKKTNHHRLYRIGSGFTLDQKLVEDTLAIEKILRQSCSTIKPIGGFGVKLPNVVDFVNAQVVVVSGQQNLVKYNLVGTGLVQNGLVEFGQLRVIDKVKVRTVYGKEYTYTELKPDQVLEVNVMPHFETGLNQGWRSTSVG